MHDGLNFKWAWWRRGATANPQILRESVNTSSIMVRNASSIMQREATRVTSG